MAWLNIAAASTSKLSLLRSAGSRMRLKSPISSQGCPRVPGRQAGHLVDERGATIVSAWSIDAGHSEAGGVGGELEQGGDGEGADGVVTEAKKAGVPGGENAARGPLRWLELELVDPRRKERARFERGDLLELGFLKTDDIEGAADEVVIDVDAFGALP